MTAKTITLADPVSGARASILLQGLNCYQFCVPTASGELEVLWAEPGFEQGDKRPSGSGIPLLFPFPGRIAGTEMHWDGKTYSLSEGDGRGNAIHGFVHERPWRVLEQDGDRLVAQFHAAQDDPALLAYWPADFRITATYQVRGSCLSSHFVMDNPSDTPLPCGFGTHPYFALPLGSGSADTCQVRLPVAGQWELVEMNATGRKLTLDNAQVLQAGQAFLDMNYDTVFTDLIFNNGLSEAVIEDPATSRRVQVTFDNTFRECVVYTPPHRQAICIEPYTCIPDPFRLHSDQLDAGLRVLEAGESFESHVEIHVA